MEAFCYHNLFLLCPPHGTTISNPRPRSGPSTSIASCLRLLALLSTVQTFSTVGSYILYREVSKAGRDPRIRSRPADRSSVFRYDPHGVNDAGYIAEYRQKDVYPEVLANPYLKEHSKRRKQDRGHKTQYIHRKISLI